jgi:hypothetical protein
MVQKGGDDLEENFVFGDSGSERSDVSDAGSESEVCDEETAEDAESPSADNSDLPAPKKQKLNWREAASASTGDSISQKAILTQSIVAAAKYFPNQPLPLSADQISELRITDLSQFKKGDDTSFKGLLTNLREHGTHLTAACEGLNVIFVTGSASRAMYLVKELRDFDKTLSPLPMFFHGGGRKKEQAKTQEAVLRDKKAPVAVTLPSRLVSVCDSNVVDLHKVGLVVFDLKVNEKGVNVLSQKDTMLDSLRVIGEYIANGPNTIVMI